MEYSKIGHKFHKRLKIKIFSDLPCSRKRKIGTQQSALEMSKSRVNPRDTELDVDPYNAWYQTPGFTAELSIARAIADGKQAAPYKPPLQPPAGGFERWFEQASRWMIYVMSPGNGVVRELITRRAQYLANMTNPKKKQFDALKSFNDVNRQLRDKFLLPQRGPLNFCDALNNNDDVADFLRANNLMK